MINQNGIRIIEALEKFGYEARFAGGCVRDFYLGIEPKDWDIATTATPDKVMSLFEKVIPTGLDHGTVTVVIDGENFEVTTLRVDVETDGRHAKVEFTTDWVKDAARRDFTMNAMYMAKTGRVFDYFNGINDIFERKLCFVGSPVDRITEDALRILRYFRFLGRFDNPNTDAHTLAEISSCAEMLGNISGERCWWEFKKIMAGTNPWFIVSLMEMVNVTVYCGGPFDVMNLKAVQEITQNPISRAMLSAKDKDHFFRHMGVKFKVSNFELYAAKAFSQVETIEHTAMCGLIDPSPASILYNIIIFIESTKRYEDFLEVVKIRAATDPLYAKYHEFLVNYNVPRWPITGDTLLAEGYKPGPEFGDELNKRKFEWFKKLVKQTVDL